MSSYVFGFQEIDRTKLGIVGGKGANLGELSRIEGIHVPEGFCVSTEAFKRITGETSSIGRLLDQLSPLKVEDRKRIGELSGEIRRDIEGIAIPQDIIEEVTRFLYTLGEKNAYAVRSSATAEDLPTASFAGQQDTYLNIIGSDAILNHIRKCWASLFTERAVTYRVRNGFDHRKVHLSVVIQRMIFPQASGILFTADPVTSNRKVSSIDASFGLGEALVSGLVNPDIYKVSSGRIISKKISEKKLAIYASRDGGTEELEIEPVRQNMESLTDDQIFQLERMGRKVEEHFGSPQDIEWSLSEGPLPGADDTLFILQSRPITTLYPIPEANDRENHVYISVGHQQMMTDSIKPLGISFWQLTAARPMYEAGGRLFVDVAQQLASRAGRGMLLATMGQHDPLIKDSLMTMIERDFIRLVADDTPTPGQGRSEMRAPAQGEDDPAIVSDLIKNSEALVEELKQNIQTRSGVDLFDLIQEDVRKLRKTMFDPRSMSVIITVINASSWINEKMKEWLGEENAADTLSQSAPNNITSEMGLALLDVADVIRPHHEVIEHLRRVKDDDFPDELAGFDGGKECRDAILAFLDKYGMRCSGEIDITRPRWSENPVALVSMILGNIKNFEPGESKRRFERGHREASKNEQELLDRLMLLPDGEEKAEETKRKIRLIRNFSGYREYPKYHMMCRYFVYKQALLKEAGRLAQAGVIREKEDVYYLAFEELREVARSNKIDYELIGKRKEEYKSYERLTPPRVITSEGEIIAGEYKRENLPAEAIAGLAVSSGVVEGRARVILKMEDADLEEGDILVTTFTDPSWTPLFVSIKGLVTEVGGQNTHGAVIAREYGLPAVVGVENATRLIKDGQRIRVNGIEGYIEILH